MRAGEPGLPSEGGYVTTNAASLFDQAANWGRRYSLWPYPFGTACCGIEVMGVLSNKFDIARFGAELVRFSPRQADLLIVAGNISFKMAPVLRRIYMQMCHPKWVIAMGACASCGGFYDNYSTVQGIDKVIHVDVYIPGCPPRPEAFLDALVLLQKKISSERPGDHPRAELPWPPVDAGPRASLLFTSAGQEP
jgi:NADH-quinone oxidoreductase subunit B